jgi:hypothetical protein
VVLALGWVGMKGCMMWFLILFLCGLVGRLVGWLVGGLLCVGWAEWSWGWGWSCGCGGVMVQYRWCGCAANTLSC